MITRDDLVGKKSTLRAFRATILGKKIPLENKTKIIVKRGYTVYKDDSTHGLDIHVIDKKGKVAIELYLQRRGAMYHVDVIASVSKDYKAHELYHDLLTKNIVDGLITSEQSPGGRTIWDKLSKFRNVEIFGWDPSNKSAINLGKRLPDEVETHVSTYDDAHDRDTNQIRRMQLVAIKKP